MEKKPQLQKYSGVKLTDEEKSILEGLNQIPLSTPFNCLEKLSRNHRRVLLMDKDGLKLEDIAAAMNVALGTAKSRVHRARQALIAIRESTT